MRGSVESKTVTSCLQHWSLALFLVHLSWFSSQCLAKRKQMRPNGKSSEINLLPSRWLPKLQNNLRWVWIKSFSYWGHHRRSLHCLLTLHFVGIIVAILKLQRPMQDTIERKSYFVSATLISLTQANTLITTLTGTRRHLFILFYFLAVPYKIQFVGSGALFMSLVFLLVWPPYSHFRCIVCILQELAVPVASFTTSEYH